MNYQVWVIALQIINVFLWAIVLLVEVPQWKVILTTIESFRRLHQAVLIIAGMSVIFLIQEKDLNSGKFFLVIGPMVGFLSAFTRNLTLLIIFWRRKQQTKKFLGP